MRKLIYVPVIHMSADLGSIAKQVDSRGIAGFGEEFWKKHKESVSGFWDVIAEYFADLKVAGFKVFQDGMVTHAEVGQKIVEEGIKAGSKNYEIVGHLLKQGATLVQTEEFALVKEERDRLVKITQAKSTIRKLLAFLVYKLKKNRLLKKRDRFIARQINATLHEDETGVLFLGAYHDVIANLAQDIQIQEVKEVKKVRDYQRMLLSVRKDQEKFDELGKYLVSPVA
ncbi:MAG: hypothetical protein L6437_07790 [Kiritimatiellae bacterium]|nr:hypothetical protein [Kiritimatiellia bacterium]